MGIAPLLSMRASQSQAGSRDPAPGANEIFVRLLMTQLQNQSPLNPLDPNEFAGELVQFNVLDQLIQIRSLLQQALDAAPVADASATSVQGAR